MADVVLSEKDFAALQGVVRAGESAYDAALLLRGMGQSPVRSDMAMVDLRAALDAAKGIKPKESKSADKSRTHATKK